MVVRCDFRFLFSDLGGHRRWPGFDYPAVDYGSRLVAVFTAARMARRGLVGALAIALLLWVAKRGRAFGRNHQYALTVAFSVLVSYHLFVYDLTILLIPMMAALGLADQGESRAAKTAVLIPLLAVPVGLLWRPFLM